MSATVLTTLIVATALAALPLGLVEDALLRRLLLGYLFGLATGVHLALV